MEAWVSLLRATSTTCRSCLVLEGANLTRNSRVEVDYLQKRAGNKSQGLVRFDCWTARSAVSELVSNVMTVRSPLVIISVRDPLRRVLSAWNHYRQSQI